jgi:two-component system response regulator YesN
MIKVQIVDDEYLIRQLLINSISWKELGFEIICEAEDGQEALDNIHNFKPDLVIIDINIPIIDGIQLTNIINEKYPHIKMVLFTGYADFEYAKTAIRNGVCEYFVKPLEPTEFTTALKKLKIIIDNQKNLTQKLNHYNKQFKTNHTLIKDQFIKKLLYNEYNETIINIPNKLNEYCLENLFQNYYIATVHINYLHKHCNNNSEIQLWRTTITNVIKETFENHCQVETCIDRSNNILCIIEHSIEVSVLHELFEQVYTWNLKHLNFNLIVGISNLCKSYIEIYKGYEQSIDALNLFYWNSSKSIYYYNEVTTCHNISFNKKDFHETSLKLMRTNEIEKLTSHFNDLFHSISVSHTPKTQVQLLVKDLIELLKEYIMELNIPEIEYLNDIQNHYNTIQKFETVEDTRVWLVQLYLQSFNDINDSIHSKLLNLALEARTYIENNFTNPLLNLDELACALFVSPSYLSKVYKQELGVNISQEITNFRLDKSKKLLDEKKKIKLSTLAQMVGYSDVYYFSRCFKKKYGLSPRKYVETKRSKINL